MLGRRGTGNRTGGFAESPDSDMEVAAGRLIISDLELPLCDLSGALIGFYSKYFNHCRCDTGQAENLTGTLAMILLVRFPKRYVSSP